MKIAFITTHLTVYGGAGKVILDYSNRLSELGHQIVVVSQKIDREKYKFNKEVLLIEIGGFLPSNPIYWLMFKKIKNNYLNVLNKLDIDIYFSHMFPTNYFCSKIKNDNDFRHIYYCHEPFRYFYDKNFISRLSISNKLMALILKFFFKKYDIIGSRNTHKIMCNSDFTKNKVKEIYKIDSLLFYPILNPKYCSNGDQFNLRKCLNVNYQKPIIFALGFSHHMKGLNELMIIFKKILIKVPHVVLLIGGSLPKKTIRYINKLMNKLNINSKNLIFYGFIDENLLNSFYSQSTITIYTAIEEPFGLIPLESMKNGTPVIAFKEGGPSETIINDKTGYLIEKKNLDDFARKSLSLILNKELRKLFSKNAKKYVNEKFNYQKTISNLEIIFRTILALK